MRVGVGASGCLSCYVARVRSCSMRCLHTSMRTSRRRRAAPRVLYAGQEAEKEGSVLELFAYSTRVTRRRRRLPYYNVRWDVEYVSAGIGKGGRRVQYGTQRYDRFCIQGCCTVEEPRACAVKPGRTYAPEEGGRSLLGMVGI